MYVCMYLYMYACRHVCIMYIYIYIYIYIFAVNNTKRHLLWCCETDCNFMRNQIIVIRLIVKEVVSIICKCA